MIFPTFFSELKFLKEKMEETQRLIWKTLGLDGKYRTWCAKWDQGVAYDVWFSSLSILVKDGKGIQEDSHRKKIAKISPWIPWRKIAIWIIEDRLIRNLISLQSNLDPNFFGTYFVWSAIHHEQSCFTICGYCQYCVDYSGVFLHL